MSLRILIVDDELDATVTLAKFLRSRGHTTSTAANGHEAYEAVMSEDFDVVMTDLRMPGMDGADFLAKLRVERPGIPIIVMTGYTEIDSSDRIWADAGVSEVFQKPLDLRKISQILDVYSR